MRVAIHQPNFLPWMGYFDKMAKADTFVIFDDVQLPMSGHCYETRARIQGSNGPIELNIPVEHRGKTMIKDTRLVPGRWQNKHFKSIALNYPKAHGLDNLAEIYAQDWKFLLDFDLELIRLLAGWLGIQTQIVLSSELGVPGSGTEKILGIIKALGGDTYISGTGAGSRRYVSEEVFSSSGVNLLWQSYSGPNFSAVDSLWGSRHLNRSVKATACLECTACHD